MQITINWDDKQTEQNINNIINSISEEDKNKIITQSFANYLEKDVNTSYWNNSRDTIKEKIILGFTNNLFEYMKDTPEIKDKMQLICDKVMEELPQIIQKVLASMFMRNLQNMNDDFIQNTIHMTDIKEKLNI